MLWAKLRVSLFQTEKQMAIVILRSNLKGLVYTANQEHIIVQLPQTTCGLIILI